MSDGFSKTISSISGDYSTIADRSVSKTQGITGKKVERGKDSTEERESERRREYYSEIIPPDAELWNTLIEAVDEFNRRQDIHNSPFSVRLWAQNNGFRVQLIHELTGDLIKQTSVLAFEESTRAELNNIINDLVSGIGVVLDVTR
ncbi:MAG TPA: hypothetical protein PLN69_11050 [bacterium]|nr:hypothetical protein [bacterium]